ncbi:YciI family protein [Azospirillum sp. A29]|jgi:uncharacterized protein YciI|uniref:YciI family protein n=1 Tax=Azospirillum sp. A29 TaxID=3160606 RepID=UPI00366BD4E4
MIVVRVACSDPRKAAERQRLIEAHKAYLRSGGVRILQSGPLTGSSVSGGLVVAEVGAVEEFVAFSDGDPFVLHGVYDDVRIFEWTVTLGSIARSDGAERRVG